MSRKGRYTIYNTYEDIISGAARERKALDHLFADAKKRKGDIVLVFDRSARSLKMLVDLLALFQELGIDFISKNTLIRQRAWEGSCSILIVPTLSASERLSKTEL
jgi:DNA invertase Pin-like site-specific DNA recombinase